MSMTSKTTNNLFNIGVGNDTFSLYDFNANFEQADNLINGLQRVTDEHEVLIENLENKTVSPHSSETIDFGHGTEKLYGHCKVMNNLTTDKHTAGVALSAYQGYELNKAIENSKSLFFGGRTYMSYQSDYLLSKSINLPEEFATKDVNNFYVIVTLEDSGQGKIYTPFIRKDNGCFTVFVKDEDGNFSLGRAIWFNYIVIIRH